MKNKIIEREENRVKNEIENEVIKTVVENAKVDIPQVMIDNRLDGIVQDFDLRLVTRNLSGELFKNDKH